MSEKETLLNVIEKLQEDHDRLLPELYTIEKQLISMKIQKLNEKSLPESACIRLNKRLCLINNKVHILSRKINAISNIINELKNTLRQLEMLTRIEDKINRRRK